MMQDVFFEPSGPAIHHLLQAVHSHENWQINSIGAGVTSLAWEAVSDSERLIVRAMPPASPKPITYPQEMFILRQLYADGWPVPEPIADSQSHPHASFDFQWAITRQAKGHLIDAHKFPHQVAFETGQLLAACHAMPTKGGWGWPNLSQNQLGASQPTPVAGACERWADIPLWPLDDSLLDTHAIGQVYPALVDNLKTIAAELIEVASTSDRGLCHTDLHPQHFFVQDEKLMALIDFGDACVLPPAWDVALMAFYYGWTTVDRMLEGYTDSASQRRQLLEQAYRLGIIISLNKLEKSFRRPLNHKSLEALGTFMQSCFASL